MHGIILNSFIHTLSLTDTTSSTIFKIYNYFNHFPTSYKQNNHLYILWDININGNSFLGLCETCNLVNICTSDWQCVTESLLS